MASPILAELGSRMTLEGQASELAHFQAKSAAERQELADGILGRRGGVSVPASLHRWMPLPAHLRTASFVADALANDVAVTAGDVFAVSYGFDPGAVRICLCSEPDRDRLEAALRVLARLIGQDQSAALPVV
jgi:DNA-binding transcriptional MocR family regulator